MFRIKTTTSKGNVFYSPFVYEKDVIEEKVRKMGWLVKHKKAKMEIIEVTNYPKEAIHDWMVLIRDPEHDLPHFMRLVETKGKEVNSNADNGEDIEEMEEGSTERESSV